MADWKHAETLRQHAQEPTEAEIQRVRRAAMERVAQRRRVPSWAWASAAVVAAATLAWLAWPQAPAPQHLASVDDWSQAHAQPGVQLAFHGQGQVSSPSVVTWEQGELEVEVEPERGIDFRVVTAEASIRVVGTVFAVERSSLGTSVTVKRGMVEVTCQDEPTESVSSGQAHLCLRSPAAALHWADSHPEGTANDVLRVLDRGLARSSPGDPVHDELEVLRIQTLAQDGRARDALRAATDRLDRAEPHRTREVRQIAARAALELDGCDAAQPHLEILASSNNGAAMVLLADCITGSQPQRAHELLQRALTLAPPSSQEAAIRQRLESLDAGGAHE